MKVAKNTKRDLLILTVLLTAIYVFLYRNIFGLEVIYQSDLTPIPNNGYQLLLFSWLYRGLGRPNDASLGIILLAMLGEIFRDALIVQKLFYLLPMPIAGVTMYLFINRVTRSSSGRIAISIMYSLNPLTIWLFPGRVTALIAYAIFPLLLLFLTRLLEKNFKMFDVFMLALLLGLASSFLYEIIFFFIPFIISFLIVYLLEKSSIKYGIKALLATSLTLIILVLLVFPTYLSYAYIFMGVLEHPSELAGFSIDYLLQAIENYSKVSQQYFYGFVFITILLSLFGLFLRDRARMKKYLTYVLPVALIIFFWASLVHGFGLGVFIQFPILFVFREHNLKLVLMLVPAFAAMVALLIDEADSRGLFNVQRLLVRENIRVHLNLGRRMRIKSFHLRLNAGEIAVGITLLMLLLAPTLMYDLSYDQHTSLFLEGNYPSSEVEVPPAYMEVREWLESREGNGEFFRILWLPFTPATDRILAGYIPEAYHGAGIELGEFVLRTLCEGGAESLGRILAPLNIKYVIVELTPKDWGNPNWVTGSAHADMWEPTSYHATGDPDNFIKILNEQEDLRLVAAESDFLVYENIVFVPHITVYDQVLLLPPIACLDVTETSLMYDFTVNFIHNPGFENDLVSWQPRTGNWSVDGSVKYFGNFSLRCDNSYTQEHCWADVVQSIRLEENTWYNISGWMKTQNVRDSQVAIQFYNESDHVVGGIVPQSSIVSGTRDWWKFSVATLTPPGTVKATIGLYAGWSQNGSQLGITWFDDIQVKKDKKTMFLLPLSLMFNIPGFNADRQLLLSSDLLSSDQLTEYLGISDTIIFLGDANIDTTCAFGGKNVNRLVFLFQASSELVPVDGEWLVEREESSVYGYVAKCVGSGKAVKNFYALRAGWYGMAMRLQTNGNFSVNIDGKPMNISHVESNTSFEWYETSPVYLTQGTHQMDFFFNANLTMVDQIIVFSLWQRDERVTDVFGSSLFEVHATETGPAEYNVHVKSDDPVFIVLGESYDSEWAAYLGDARIEHFPALPFSWANGFYVNATEEEVDIRIVFERQRTRNLAVVITVTAWISVLTILAVLAIKPRLTKS